MLRNITKNNHFFFQSSWQKIKNRNGHQINARFPPPLIQCCLGHQWHFQGTLKALFLASLGVQVVLISTYICHEKIELSLDIALDEIWKLIKWGWVWYREEFFRSRRPVGLRRITTFLVLHTLYIIGNFNSVIGVLNSKYFLVPNITTLSQTFFKAGFASFLGTVSDQKSAGDIRQAMFSFIFSQ